MEIESYNEKSSDIPQKRLEELRTTYADSLAGLVDEEWTFYLSPDEKAYVQQLESIVNDTNIKTEQFVSSSTLYPKTSDEEFKDVINISWAGNSFEILYNQEGELEQIKGDMEAISEYMELYRIPRPKQFQNMIVVDGMYNVTADLGEYLKHSEYPKMKFWYETPDKHIVSIDKTTPTMEENKFRNREQFYLWYDTETDELFKTSSNEVPEETYKRSIYVCSPLAGEIEKNIINARSYGRFVAEQGAVPLAPHVTEMFNDLVPLERQLGLAYGIDLLKKADEIWVFGDYISNGMQKEIEYAQSHGMPISKVDVNTFVVTPFPGQQVEKEIQGFKVLLENASVGFGYNSGTEPHLAAWRYNLDGSLKGIVKQNSFTLDEYRNIQESGGMKLSAIWNKLDQIGIVDYIAHDNSYNALGEVTLAKFTAQNEHYGDRLLSMQPQDILDNSYEYVIKGEICNIVAGDILTEQYTPEQLEAISNLTLDDIYSNEWIGCDYDSVPEMMNSLKEQLLTKLEHPQKESIFSLTD